MHGDIRRYDLARLIARGVADDRAAALERELIEVDNRDAQDPLDELWSMTAAERVAAMRAGELSLEQLAAWSRRAPHEVPRIGFPGRGPHRDDEGAFEWIAVSTADWLEASETRAPRHISQNRRSRDDLH